MRKKVNKILSLLIASSLLLCACGGDPQAQGEGEYRSGLTAEERESGHASFMLGEDLAVDAYITPESVWKKQYAVYYLQVVTEPDSSDAKAFRKAPTLYGHSIKEWKKLLDGLEPGRLEGKGLVLNDGRLEGTYREENGREYDVLGDWAGNEKKYGVSTLFNSPCFSVEPPLTDDWTDPMWPGIRILEAVPDYGDGGQDPLEDSEGVAEKLRKFLEQASGRKIHERYRYVPVTRANVDRANETLNEYTRIDTPENEYGAFLFWYDVDGLPLRATDQVYNLKAGEKAAPLSRWASDSGGSLSSFSENVQLAAADKDGLMYLNTSNMREPGEACREKASVVEPDKILEQLREYYEKRLLPEGAVVEEVELIYTGYFLNVEGTVHPVVTPVWEAIVRDNPSDGSDSQHRFVYDAFTGSCLGEGESITWY